MRFELTTKNGGFVAFFQMVSRSIHDIFAEQEELLCFWCHFVALELH